MKKFGIFFVFLIFISLFAFSGCYTSLQVQKETDDTNVSVYKHYDNVYYSHPYWYYTYRYIPSWNSWHRFGFYWDGSSIGWWNHRYERPWLWNHKFSPPKVPPKFRDIRIRNNDGGRGIIKPRNSPKDNSRERIRNDRNDNSSNKTSTRNRGRR